MKPAIIENSWFHFTASSLSGIGTGGGQAFVIYLNEKREWTENDETDKKY